MGWAGLDEPSDAPMKDWGFRSFFEHAVEGIFRTSPRGRYLAVNPALAALYGFDAPEQLIRELTDIGSQLYVDPGRREEFRRLIEAEGAVNDFESEIVRRDGSHIWISEQARAVRDDLGRLVYYEGTVQDVTDRVLAEHAARESEDRYRLLVESAHNPIVIWDASGAAVYANPAAARMFGHAQPPGLDDLSMPDERDFVRRHFDALFDGAASPVHRERRVLRADGSRAEVIETLTVLHRAGRPHVVVAEYHDLTELREVTRELRRVVEASLVTDLPNRRWFVDRVEAAIAEARSRRSLLAVTVVDMDRFKLVNDSLGHAAGDGILREIGGRLRVLGTAGLGVHAVAHLGGDEFALLIEAPEADGLLGAARAAVDAVGEPIEYETHALYLAASAGVAVFPRHAMDADGLLRRAERAMYEAKQQGGRRVCVDEAEDRQGLDRLRLEYDLRRAIDTGGLVLQYQPLLDVSAGRVTGVEALIRWPHPDRGQVSPAEFVPVLEQIGMIQPVTAWVIESAAAQTAEWRRAGLDLSVAVNISPRLFSEGDLLRLANAAIGQHGLPPCALEFEVTEGETMPQIEQALPLFEALRSAGFGVALDDFGVGHSSFGRLREIPLTKMKIDRSLVSQVDSDPEALTILRGLTGLGRAAGLRVVAEGVETLGEFETVVTAGAHEVQGYAISRPVPPELIPAVVERHRGRRRAA